MLQMLENHQLMHVQGEAGSTGGVQVISSILPSICNTLPDGSPQMFSITLQ